MKTLIKNYIASKELAWSPTTIRSETSRLSALEQVLATTSPDALWKALADKGSYTRATTWTRVCDFYKWLIEEGHAKENPYQTWRDKHARQFKHAYKRRPAALSFQEAAQRIESLQHAGVRERARRLLRGGLRYIESVQQPEEGQITGKGGKRRKTFVSGPKRDSGISYWQLYRALKEIGLTPHMLRKICVTEMARKGLSAPDLCEFAGWESFSTAASYIAASQERISKAVEELGDE